MINSFRRILQKCIEKEKDKFAHSFLSLHFSYYTLKLGTRIGAEVGLFHQRIGCFRESEQLEVYQGECVDGEEKVARREP